MNDQTIFTVINLSGDWIVGFPVSGMKPTQAAVVTAVDLCDDLLYYFAL